MTLSGKKKGQKWVKIVNKGQFYKKKGHYDNRKFCSGHIYAKKYFFFNFFLNRIRITRGVQKCNGIKDLG